jgi:predicted enzyme related to lactoylglutathione lyase
LPATEINRPVERELQKKNPGLMAVALFVAGCAAVAPNLPSITDAPTGNRDNGRVVWHDLLTNTPDESRRFYSELFGWEFERPTMVSSGAYYLIRHNGRLIGGMVDANRLDNSDISQWVTVISVDDIDAAVRRLEREGGAVLTPPTEVGLRGTLAVVTGSDGALFAMVKTRDGDPDMIDPETNGWLWNELWTDDIDKSTRFYESVFGLTPDDRQIENVDYRLLQSGDTPRAGILPHPYEGNHPVWVNYIRVDDPTAITSRVEELGGQVLLDTEARDIGGKVAFVAGPSGAGVALQTWPLD